MPTVVIRAVLLTVAALPMPAFAGEPDVEVSYSEEREACSLRSATRNAYFGDLHIHTGFSYDARPLGTTTTPADAYRFARGEAIAIPPYDEEGRPVGELQLKRPLDFAAVTDHAEFFGEYQVCGDPQSPQSQLEICKGILSGAGTGTWPLLQVILAEEPSRNAEICGEDGSACFKASRSLWEQTRRMADEAYDRTSNCGFTTFTAYEYTGTPNSNNLHRNVIFRNSIVPAQPVSYVEAPRDHDLRTQLQRQCLEGLPGCDVLSIPHNSNLSGGTMFPAFAGTLGSQAAERERGETRNVVEPLMEIFQHKGNSECFNGLPNILGAPDELCEVEQMRALGEKKDPFRGKEYDVGFCQPGEVGKRGFIRVACISGNDFFRSALLNGLQDEAAIGVNSYRLGVIASTDTHTSIAGGTDEATWPGHLVDEATLEERLEDQQTSPRRLHTNPGGLAGVWAVENSRDALFNAMQRREVFGTSGTRIRPRLFAGWDIDANACEKRDVAEHGYAAGVPMGATLGEAPEGGRLHLLVTALRDPDAAPLQKLQLIKGWVDDRGQSRYRVFDVAGKENEEGTLDLETGKWSGAGAASLCAVFVDPVFNAGESAYYYLRAVEVPTLRWSWAQCQALPASKRPAACENSMPKRIQEMAWTSPIWYSPFGYPAD